uniref:Uncharacterized protein n=1 Tax=Anguilla anguilla TaxID=7936 RepID=A0A0E9TJC3_ANGAN
MFGGEGLFYSILQVEDKLRKVSVVDKTLDRFFFQDWAGLRL